MVRNSFSPYPCPCVGWILLTSQEHSKVLDMPMGWPGASRFDHLKGWINTGRDSCANYASSSAVLFWALNSSKHYKDSGFASPTILGA